MTDSSKYRLIAAFVLAAVCMPAPAKGIDEPAARLTFAVDQRTVSWMSTDNRSGRVSRVPIKEGLIRPSHRAELFVTNLASGRTMIKGLLVDAPSSYFQGPEAISGILNAPAGRKVSAAQREFLEGGRAIYREGSFGERVEGHFCFWVYGVSREDVEKTTQAFVEHITAEAEANRQYWLSERKKISEDWIPEAKKGISEAEGEIKAVQTRLDTLKKTVHYVSPEEAMETILEFNKILNTLEVEIAGLQARVAANKKYVAERNPRDEVLARLQQTLADDTIDLADAQAKNETATKIRNEAKLFYDLDRQVDELPKSLDIKKRSLSSLEKRLKDAADKTTDPYSGTIPPKVFENKVTINSVHTD